LLSLSRQRGEEAQLVPTSQIFFASPRQAYCRMCRDSLEWRVDETVNDRKLRSVIKE
jgi:hypothetical protein